MAGCAPRAVSAVATVEFQSASTAEKQAAAAILQARLAQPVKSVVIDYPAR